MSIYIDSVTTRQGDRGKTRLANGDEVSKLHPRIRATGSIDTLTCHIGVAYTQTWLRNRTVACELRTIQEHLYDLGAQISADSPRMPKKHTETIETFCAKHQPTLDPLKSFVLPGGTIEGAWLHLCRATCRAAELDVWAVNDEVGGLYLNRLADYLFVAARVLDKGNETLWTPAKPSD